MVVVGAWRPYTGAREGQGSARTHPRGTTPRSAGRLSLGGGASAARAAVLGRGQFLLERPGRGRDGRPVRQRGLPGRRGGGGWAVQVGAVAPAAVSVYAGAGFLAVWRQRDDR